MFPLVGPIAVTLTPQLPVAPSAETGFDAAAGEFSAVMSRVDVPLTDQLASGGGAQSSSLVAASLPLPDTVAPSGTAKVMAATGTPPSKRPETAPPLQAAPADETAPCSVVMDQPVLEVLDSALHRLPVMQPLTDPPRTAPPPEGVGKSTLPDHLTASQSDNSLPTASGNVPAFGGGAQGAHGAGDADPLVDEPVLPLRGPASKPKPPVKRAEPPHSQTAESAGGQMVTGPATEKVLPVHPDKAPPDKAAPELAARSALPETVPAPVLAGDTAVAAVKDSAVGMIPAPVFVAGPPKDDGDVTATGALRARPESAAIGFDLDAALSSEQAWFLPDMPPEIRRQTQVMQGPSPSTRPVLSDAKIPVPLAENAGPELEPPPDPAPEQMDRAEVQAVRVIAVKTPPRPETQPTLMIETPAQPGPAIIHVLPHNPMRGVQGNTSVADAPMDQGLAPLYSASPPLSAAAAPTVEPVAQVTAPQPLDGPIADASVPPDAAIGPPVDRPASDQPSPVTDLFPAFADAAPVGVASVRVGPVPPVAPEMAAPLRAAPPIVPQVLQGFGRAAEKGDRIEVSLSPKELGQLRVEITQGADGAKVIVTAERPETLELVRRHAQELVAEFRQAGLGHASLSFGTWSGQDTSQRGAGAWAGAQGDGGDQGRAGVRSGAQNLSDRPAEPARAGYPQRAESGGGLILRI